MRALIVDDDLSVSGLMRRCLSTWGWISDESHSVSAALELFKHGHYDLAVCDVDLPDGDGIFLARALSKVKPSLHVVIVSGRPENVDRARAAGFSRCLQKPFELDALKALLDHTSPAKEQRAPSDSVGMEHMGKHGAISFILPGTDWYAARVEVLWAKPLGGDRFQIRNAPFYAYGCSLDDIVTARKDKSGRLVFESVVKRGGHSTYRLIVSEGKEDQFQKYWDPLARLGCEYERTGRLYAVDVPPTAEANQVHALLTKGRTDGAWGFEGARGGHESSPGR